MKNRFAHYEFLRLSKIPQNPVYLIYGEENYLKDKVEKAILNKFIEVDEIDKIVLYGDKSKVSIAILEELEMRPFLSDYRVVVLKNFEQMSPSGQKRILRYCQNPVETSILLLTSQKSDLKTAVLKKIAEKSISINCRKPYNFSDILKWLNIELRNKNINIEPKAATLFAGSIELNYNIAANELEKLLIYTKDTHNISYDDVLASVGQNSVKNVFDLQNTLGERNLKESLRLMENMLQNQVSEILIISMLTRYFLLILKILALKKQNIGENEIMEKHMWEVFRNFRRGYIEAANHYNRKEIQNVFAALLKADTDLKSKAKLEKVIMTTMIFEICQKGI